MEKSQPPPAPEKAEASGVEGSPGSGGGGPLPAPRCPLSGSFSPLRLELVAETQLSLEETWVRAETKRGR